MKKEFFFYNFLKLNTKLNNKIFIKNLPLKLLVRKKVNKTTNLYLLDNFSTFFFFNIFKKKFIPKKPTISSTNLVVKKKTWITFKTVFKNSSFPKKVIFAKSIQQYLNKFRKTTNFFFFNSINVKKSNLNYSFDYYSRNVALKKKSFFFAFLLHYLPNVPRKSIIKLFIKRKGFKKGFFKYYSSGFIFKQQIKKQNISKIISKKQKKLILLQKVKSIYPLKNYNKLNLNFKETFLSPKKYDVNFLKKRKLEDFSLLNENLQIIPNIKIKKNYFNTIRKTSVFTSLGLKIALKKYQKTKKKFKQTKWKKKISKKKIKTKKVEFKKNQKKKLNY